ncbi:hypothetical protein [Croceicoccus marinus]|uniref:Uncharacterized protein n=1 Tax=Croceicoccus marinus TaxID=450378 RepID=A0A1Z1FCM6_9SPHN|nr:hypothetical protein [Croceicoccus marinus]ARU16437.1 hypothetical protein A9D14_09915 [Croceicoccus marinus]
MAMPAKAQDGAKPQYGKTAAGTAPAETAKSWFGGNYLGAAPPASARPELSRGGWGTKSREDEITLCRLKI